MTHAKALLKLTSLMACMLLLAVITANAENYCLANNPGNQTPVVEEVSFEKSTMSHSPYSGILKIYMVEPNSRYRMYGTGTGNGDPYHFGFIGFAVNQAINISSSDTLSNTVTWNGTSLDSHNLMAIAVIFNQEGHPAQSRPGYTTYPFTAHWTEAAAGANCGEVVSDTAHGAYTHNVFLEEATGTWCPYCPAMASALHSIWTSGAYQFYYAAMIEDVNSQANARCEIDYNIYGYPTCYYDGGYGVSVGGNASPGAYTPTMNATGARATRDLFLQVGLEYISTTQVSVTYKIHARDFNNLPTATQPTNNCPMIRVNEDEQFLCTVSEPDADTVYVKWTFGDGDTTDWIGPYYDGSNCGVIHQWATPGQYDVKVLTRDNLEIAKNWSTPRTVTVSGCVCGEANGDGGVDISDAVFLISHIFSGGPTPGPCACSGTGNAQGDANGDSGVDISDAVYLISHIFSGGPAPHCP